MNAPASPPSPDPGFSVEPPPLPEFDCTVDLDLDPAPRGLHRVLRYFKPRPDTPGPAADESHAESAEGAE